MKKQRETEPCQAEKEIAKRRRNLEENLRNLQPNQQNVDFNQAIMLQQDSLKELAAAEEKAAKACRQKMNRQPIKTN